MVPRPTDSDEAHTIADLVALAEKTPFGTLADYRAGWRDPVVAAGAAMDAAWWTAGLPALPVLTDDEVRAVEDAAVDACLHVIAALPGWPMIESAGAPAVDRWGALRPLPTGNADGAACALDALARIATVALGLVEEVRPGGPPTDRPDVPATMAAAA